MERLAAFMSRRVAGVPVGVIAVIIAAGLLFLAFKLPKQSEEIPADDGDGEGDAPFGDGVDVSQPVFGATPVIYQPSGGGGAGGGVASTPQADTNALWGKRATEWLMTQGASVNEASAAISKYLSGEPLNTAETKWRDKAIAQFGFPPEGVEYVAPVDDSVPTPTAPPPPAAPGPYTGPAVSQGKPPLKHIVKGKSDNQARELAVLYYGTNTADAVNKIHAANTTTQDPYPTGQAVKIPERFEPQYFKSTAATNTVYEIARKNSVTAAKVLALNPGMKFPVKAGTRVRVR